jgi:hypothetical protein
MFHGENKGLKIQADGERKSVPVDQDHDGKSGASHSKPQELKAHFVEIFELQEYRETRRNREAVVKKILATANGIGWGAALAGLMTIPGVNVLVGSIASAIGISTAATLGGAAVATGASGGVLGSFVNYSKIDEANEAERNQIQVINEKLKHQRDLQEKMLGNIKIALNFLDLQMENLKASLKIEMEEDDWKPLPIEDKFRKINEAYTLLGVNNEIKPNFEQLVITILSVKRTISLLEIVHLYKPQELEESKRNSKVIQQLYKEMKQQDAQDRELLSNQQITRDEFDQRMLERNMKEFVIRLGKLPSNWDDLTLSDKWSEVEKTNNARIVREGRQQLDSLAIEKQKIEEENFKSLKVNYEIAKLKAVYQVPLKTITGSKSLQKPGLLKQDVRQALKQQSGIQPKHKKKVIEPVKPMTFGQYLKDKASRVGRKLYSAGSGVGIAIGVGAILAAIFIASNPAGWVTGAVLGGMLLGAIVLGGIAMYVDHRANRSQEKSMAKLGRLEKEVDDCTHDQEVGHTYMVKHLQSVELGEAYELKIGGLRAELKKNTEELEELKKAFAEQLKIIEQQNQVISEQAETIKDQSKSIEQKDKSIEEKDKKIHEQEEQARMMQERIKELEEQVAQKKRAYEQLMKLGNPHGNGKKEVSHRPLHRSASFSGKRVGHEKVEKEESHGRLHRSASFSEKRVGHEKVEKEESHGRLHRSASFSGREGQHGKHTHKPLQRRHSISGLGEQGLFHGRREPVNDKKTGSSDHRVAPNNGEKKV